MPVRRIASGSREFWERFAPYASASWLAKNLPPSVGGLTTPGWGHQIKTRKEMWPELPWLVISSGQRPKVPEGPVPDLIYADEVGQAPACYVAVEYTTEERVAVDREVLRLKERLGIAESKLKATYREDEVEDRIVAHLDRLVPSLPPVTAPTFRSRNKGRPESVVMLVSDYHAGEVVSSEELGGLSVYDWETFRRRWQYHVDTVGGICFGKLTGYDLPRLYVPMLGDMVTGIIHDELRETAEGTVMEWVCDGAHLIAQGIRQLAAEFPEVVVDCVIGNHGRLDKRVRFKKRYVNYDYLLYRFIALELRDLPHVTVRCNKSFYSLLEVPGATLLNLHGDNIKSWSGIPWYGITRAVTNLSLLLHAQRRSFDVVNLGHFHNAGTLDRIDSELVINGSAVGGNEFSIGALFTSTRPAQILYGVHPERGKTWEFKLDLSHGDVTEDRFSR